MKIPTLLAMLAFGGPVTGCAVLFNGTTKTVNFASIPPGGELSVTSGNYLGMTPVAAEISRGTSSTVVVKKDGYEDAHLFLEHKPQAGWFLWDLATCVIPVTLCVPLVVDAVSGAWFDYDDAYTVKLSAVKQ